MQVFNKLMSSLRFTALLVTESISLLKFISKILLNLKNGLFNNNNYLDDLGGPSISSVELNEKVTASILAKTNWGINFSKLVVV